MEELGHRDPDKQELLAELAHLRQEVAQLKQANRDLEIALITTTEHGDLIEAQLHESNRQLQQEINERKLAQATLQDILETVFKDKADLELMLQATAEHGDALAYQLYTKAVETMQQSEELFRAISESTPILMILTQRLNGAITYANSVSVERLGIDPHTYLDQTLYDFFANPDDQARLQAILTDKGQVRNYEMQIRRADGTLFWVSASVHPLHIATEQTLLTTLYDISDRKQAEHALKASEDLLRQQAQELEVRVEQRTAALREAEAKYRSFFENVAEGIFQSTPDGRYISANPALAKIYGYPSAKDLMDRITDIGQQLYVQPRRLDELMVYLKQFVEVEGFESQIYRKDGSIIWISENVRAVQDESGATLYYEGSVRDITDRKATEAELRQQRLTTERLLLNVLPQPIAERLKRGQTVIADSFPEVTVLFADIVNFTELSSHISPVEVVDLLNGVFSTFDKLADRHGLEKIKTIGDAYMVVAGLPTPVEDGMGAIANMALDMRQAIRLFNHHHYRSITLRIGVHSGPVVAGVIGTRKFIYDLWGDTVNIASRMEAQGTAGQIQVTETVYQGLKNRYRLEPRGMIDVKGKGWMNTYWLIDRVSDRL